MNAPVLDRTTLDSLRGLGRPGAPDPAAELCSMYVADMTARVASAVAAAESGDTVELSRVAHAIHGAAGCFGAGRMHVVARHLEEVAKTLRDAALARSVVAELSAELDRLRAVLQSGV